MVKTSWIKDIVQQCCQVQDIALGRHLLTPHFFAGLHPPEELHSRPCCTGSTQLSHFMDQPKKRLPHGVDMMSMYTQYNSIWDKLEKECSTKPVESEI